MAYHMRQVGRSWGLWTPRGWRRPCCPASAKPYFAAEDILHRQSLHEDSCYLEKGQRYHSRRKRGKMEKSGHILHSGFCSSHFFFLLRHVRQPVLVRLLKFRFLFALSD